MLRQEFEDHALWEFIENALLSVEKLRESAAPDETLALTRIDFILKHVTSFKALAPTSSALFNEPLITPVQNCVTQISSQIQTRQSSSSYRGYTDQALASAEAILTHVGLWPRPYAKGAHVRQITTLYEGLLEAQAKQIATFEAKTEQIRADVGLLLSQLEGKKAEVESSLEAFRKDGEAVAAVVDKEKTRIDDVVNRGLEKVNELQGQNSDAFADWKKQINSEWQSFSQDQERIIEGALRTADDALKKLKEDEKEFANISSAAGGAKLANEFDTEAKSAQKLGLWLYGIGFAILGAAAAPLVLWLFSPPTLGVGEGIWQHFLIRVSLGVLGASAATVLIRLGSRFVTGATASKRMALELQTFGPFLANVKDKETVDGARLELVDRAFGKSYANTEADSKDDAVPVSAFAHILDLVKAIK